jgi:type I restriction enzyme, S subunit
VVNEDMDVVLSSAFLKFQKKIEIESEYLALVLNSIICKLQIERLSGGAIIAHLKPSDAMILKIPILSPFIQSKIASLIVSSHESLKLSKDLLEQAKRAVEIFVEKDEECAMKEI